MQSSIDTAYKFGFSEPEIYVYKARKGLNRGVVESISGIKKEPVWMKKFRLESLKTFQKTKLPTWGSDLSKINFDNIYYYLKPIEKEEASWEKLPQSIKRTYAKLGIPKTEQKLLAGVKAQYDSEVVYGSIMSDLKNKGVVFLSMDEGLKRYPDLVRKYFGKLIRPADNKFAALNSAVWSGGSLIYVPKGVKIELPLQTYFRINAKHLGQFERTLIIADEGSFVHYLEGCTSPIHSTESLHAGVVEIYVGKKARVRYTTIQNWSNNVYNLVTKRARVEERGVMEWVDGNLGSGVTMKYPSIILDGCGAHGEILSLSIAAGHQILDCGGKAMHRAAETTSRIISKSVSLKGGRTSFRGLVSIAKGSSNSKTKVTCNSLILDEHSSARTYPTMEIAEKEVVAEHEATVSKLNEEELFFLRSRGIGKLEAETLMVNGFIEPIVKELPFEYAVELNSLLKYEMEKAIG